MEMAYAERPSTPMTVAQFRTWADRQPGRWELVDGRLQGEAEPGRGHEEHEHQPGHGP